MAIFQVDLGSDISPQCDIVFEVDGLRYLATGFIPFSPSFAIAPSPTLVTVLWTHDAETITKQWLQDSVTNPHNGDLIDGEQFLESLILTRKCPSILSTAEALDYLKSHGNRWIDIVGATSTGQYLSPGPYLHISRTLKYVYRLFDDTQGAFFAGIRPRMNQWSTTPFEHLNVPSSTPNCISLAIRPRHIADQNPNPLRVAVEDSYCLKSVKMSFGNRAYYETQPPSKMTSGLVTALLNTGAQIVGVTKLGPLMCPETISAGADYPAPFNPRGEGCQPPGRRSVGGAACVAAYDWIDCAIGTESLGMGRIAALANGVWEYRPSSTLIPARIQEPNFKLGIDSPCVFARSFSVLKEVAEAWTGQRITTISSEPAPAPIKMCIPRNWDPVTKLEHQMLLSMFTERMRETLPMTVHSFDLELDWRQSHPPGTDANLAKYLDNSVRKLWFRSLGGISQNLIEAYREKNEGRVPLLTSFMAKSAVAASVLTHSQHIEAMHKLTVYKIWLFNHMFGGPEEKLYALPVPRSLPNLRDQHDSGLGEFESSNLLFSPLLDAPHITIPIVDFQQDSKTSRQTGDVPFVVTIMGKPEEDMRLLGLMKQFLTNSLDPRTVRTRRAMFPPGYGYPIVRSESQVYNLPFAPKIPSTEDYLDSE